MVIRSLVWREGLSLVVPYKGSFPVLRDTSVKTERDEFLFPFGTTGLKLDLLSDDLLG